jgi:hypothetical protein
MSLKPITVRLDEEEYEQLKKLLDDFSDPDINVAYVLRCYIRDLNRALPFMVKSGVDLKSYLGLFGPWLKQFSSLIKSDNYSKIMINPWALWGVPAPEPGRSPETARSTAKNTKHAKTGHKNAKE